MFGLKVRKTGPKVFSWTSSVASFPQVLALDGDDAEVVEGEGEGASAAAPEPAAITTPPAKKRKQK